MKPVIDHIQITVKDLKAAETFYDKFFPLLGFDIQKKGSAIIEEHDFEVVEYSHPLLAFAITSPRQAFKDDDVHRRKPGSLHHLAFKADTHSEVDRIYKELVKIGATIVSEPRLYPEYTPENYYAVFFKDPDGIKYEVVSSVPDS
ncbi:MAG: VOC family protein [Bacteroidota bacterium]